MSTEGKYRKKENARNRRIVLFFLSPYFLGFICFFLIPLVMGFVISFMKYNPYVSEGNYFNGFKNYVTIFTSNLLKSNFWNALWTTIKFDLIAVPIMVLFPLLLAYLVSLEPPGYKIFRAIIYLPTVVSISIVGIIFGAMFDGSSTGLINSLFGTEIVWLDGFNRWVVILLASIWWQTGTNFVILSSALKSVPKTLYEACEIDGGSRWKSFWAVTLPNIKDSLELCIFNTLIGYLGLYGQPYVLNTYYNKNEISSPMMFIQAWINDFSKADLTGLVSATAIVFAFVIIIFTIIEKVVMKDRKGGKHVHEAIYEIYASENSSQAD